MLSPLLAGRGAPGAFRHALSAPDFYQHTQLTTPTYDGSGQATHPGVVKIGGGWNGWRYWMAMTPLPFHDEALENPSILVSNDGITWQVPPGGANPVASKPAQSDPDLAFWDDTLYLFWRSVPPANVDNIWLSTSTDGITWGTNILAVSGTSPSAKILSPSVLRGPDGTWRMWTVNMSTTPNTLELRTSAAPEGTWSAPTTCTAVDPEGRDLWHCDVNWDGSVYRAFLTTCTSGTAGVATRLLLGTSANGTTWTFSNAVLSPTGGANFDGDGIYRSSGVYEQGRWRVWYGAHVDSPFVWHIGYTEVDPADFP